LGVEDRTAAVLYDVTSTYFEGRTCPLAKRGYNRDGKRGKLQIVFGLMCTAEGCPVAVEVFEGNVGDPSTLASQIDKLKQRFRLEQIVLVGDRGMITEARINETIKPAGLNFITVLRPPSRAWPRRAPFRCRCSTSAISPRSARPIIPTSASSSAAIRCSRTSAAAKRRELLDATEQDLLKIQARVRRAKRPLRGKDKIGIAVAGRGAYH